MIATGIIMVMTGSRQVGITGIQRHITTTGITHHTTPTRTILHTITPNLYTIRRLFIMTGGWTPGGEQTSMASALPITMVAPTGPIIAALDILKKADGKNQITILNEEKDLLHPALDYEIEELR